jgi:hypothetical protein
MFLQTIQEKHTPFSAQMSTSQNSGNETAEHALICTGKLKAGIPEKRPQQMR